MITCFIISGKSISGAFGGGYSSVARSLESQLTGLGIKTYLISTNSKKTAMPLLPIYSLVFAWRILSICRKEKYEKIIVWGIGPWAFTFVILNLFKNLIPFYFKTQFKSVASYFTSIKHEFKGSVTAINIPDYGLSIKIKYLLLYLTLVQILSLFERITLSTADLIITNYKSTEKILSEEFGISKKKFIRTGFDLAIPKSNNGKIILPKKYILTICRQDARKGINYLLHAVRILKDKKIIIPTLIVGDGEMLEENKKLAKKLGLIDTVTFSGFIKNSHLILKNCTVFCLPTLEEGAGAIVLNEAMSYGLPIVSTNVDGITEDLKNDYSALIVPPKDPKSLADAIEKLIKNPELTKKLGTNARKEFVKNHNSEKVSKELRELIRKILSKTNF